MSLILDETLKLNPMKDLLITKITTIIKDKLVSGIDYDHRELDQLADMSCEQLTEVLTEVIKL